MTVGLYGFRLVLARIKFVILTVGVQFITLRYLQLLETKENKNGCVANPRYTVFYYRPPGTVYRVNLQFTVDINHAN